MKHIVSLLQHSSAASLHAGLGIQWFLTLFLNLLILPRASPQAGLTCIDRRLSPFVLQFWHSYCYIKIRKCTGRDESGTVSGGQVSYECIDQVLKGGFKKSAYPIGEILQAQQVISHDKSGSYSRILPARKEGVCHIWQTTTT